MTDLETRLDKALKADGAPSRDPMFRIAVMMRRDRAGLRRRLLASGVLAIVAAILAALGLGLLDALPAAERLGAEAAGCVVLAAMLVAPWLGGAAALRGLVARASWTLRSLPRPTLWP